jgi:hypothetical protein
MVMRSPCTGDALDPALWIVPNKALSLSLSLTLSLVTENPNKALPPTEMAEVGRRQGRRGAWLRVSRREQLQGMEARGFEGGGFE